MREEKADLRGKVYIMEKEKKSLELTIGSMNAQEMALKTHIQHLQDELENQELLVIHYDSEIYYFLLVYFTISSKIHLILLTIPN